MRHILSLETTQVVRDPPYSSVAQHFRRTDSPTTGLFSIWRHTEVALLRTCVYICTCVYSYCVRIHYVLTVKSIIIVIIVIIFNAVIFSIRHFSSLLSLRNRVAGKEVFYSEEDRFSLDRDHISRKRSPLLPDGGDSQFTKRRIWKT